MCVVQTQFQHYLVILPIPTLSSSVLELHCQMVQIIVHLWPECIFTSNLFMLLLMPVFCQLSLVVVSSCADKG